MIAFLIDADNFSAPAWIDEAMQTLERTEGPIAIRRAYGSAENLKGLGDTLRAWAVRPFVNMALAKNTTDMSLAVDAMELACLAPRPRTLIIGSGDLDFVPLVVRLRERGIKVICVSEHSKMAQDAVRAYDQVVYVGAAQSIALAAPVAQAALPAPVPSRAAPKKTAAKPAASKPAPPKAAPVKKAPAKKAAKKSTGTSTGTGTASDAVTVTQILAAAPGLQAGQWQPLGEVVRALHEEKLLSKSAASSKLFKKFPQHFEFMPPGKPNQVRFIVPLR